MLLINIKGFIKTRLIRINLKVIYKFIFIKIFEISKAFSALV